MADELEIINKFYEIARTPQQLNFFCETPEHARKIAEHKTWLNNIRHECPSPANHQKIGVYIRYFNQTRYEDYLAFHKQQYIDTVALCPNWEIIDFYIDEGATAPNMESAPEWCRLLNDALEGKVDLIITQKVSNVTSCGFLETLETFCVMIKSTLPSKASLSKRHHSGADSILGAVAPSSI